MQERESPYLSIVIPAYNEEKRILKTIINLVNYLREKPYTYEIIVVDDGSTDATVKVVEENMEKEVNLKVIKCSSNRGKGFAVKKGMLQGTGELLMFMDADGATEMSDIEKLIAAINNGGDIAIGSRAVQGENVKVYSSLVRKILRKTLNVLVHSILFSDIYDTQCGFKMFTKRAAKALFQKQQLTGYGFDMEILYLAKIYGYQIVEVPVSWKAIKMGKLNIFTDSVNIFFDVLKIKRLYKK